MRVFNSEQCGLLEFPMSTLFRDEHFLGNIRFISFFVSLFHVKFKQFNNIISFSFFFVCRLKQKQCELNLVSYQKLNTGINKIPSTSNFQPVFFRRVLKKLVLIKHLFHGFGRHNGIPWSKKAIISSWSETSST
jgi:hypothetical protein